MKKYVAVRKWSLAQFTKSVKAWCNRAGVKFQPNKVRAAYRLKYRVDYAVYLMTWPHFETEKKPPTPRGADGEANDRGARGALPVSGVSASLTGARSVLNSSSGSRRNAWLRSMFDIMRLVTASSSLFDHSVVPADAERQRTSSHDFFKSLAEPQEDSPK
jgi:hypothetical protein